MRAAPLKGERALPPARAEGVWASAMSFLNPALMHEGLRNYLSPAVTTTITAPGSNPRLPVGPAAPLPPGIRPIPNSSQQNKKTNVQIPYPRRAVHEDGPVGGLLKVITEGDVAFAERATFAKRKLGGSTTPDGSVVRVRTMEHFNLKYGNRELTPLEAEEAANSVAVDGVVNNVDGADPYNEFRDHAIANVAIQGPCRLGVTREEMKRVVIGDALYIGLRATELGKEAKKAEKAEKGEEGEGGEEGEEGAEEEEEGDEGEPRFKLQMVRFFASDISRKKVGLEDLRVAWHVGRIMDTHQSNLMLTINVSVNRIDPFDVDEILKRVRSEGWRKGRGGYIDLENDRIVDEYTDQNKMMKMANDYYADRIGRFWYEFDRTRSGGAVTLRPVLPASVEDQLKRRW